MVQVPVAGKPFNVTLPVAVKQFGCMIVSVSGALGVGGCAFITTLSEATEVQPEALVTVNE